MDSGTQGWIIIGIIIFTLWAFGQLSTLSSRRALAASRKLKATKQKVVSDLLSEYDVAAAYKWAKINIGENKFLLNSGQFDATNNKSDFENLGQCPKCGVGSLRMVKLFAGYNTKYRGHRYPIYKKYMRCSQYPICKYTVIYKEEQSEVGSGELSASTFMRDFKEAYDIK